MKKNLLKFLFASFTFFSFGQKETMSFHEFDIAAKTTSVKKEIRTGKIFLSKNSKLDIKRSKPALDSVAWFLSRHPKTIVSIILEKAQIQPGNNSYLQAGREQSKQIAEYLTKKGINPKRIISAVSYSAEDSDFEKNISVRIRVASNEFSDTDIK